MGQGSKTTSQPRLEGVDATLRLRQGAAPGSYQEIVEALPDAAAVLTSAGLVAAANRGLGERLQLASDLLLGEPLLAWFGRASERSAFGRAFVGLRQRPTGSSFSLEVTLVPARGRPEVCSVRVCRLASGHALLTCQAPERGADVGRALARSLEALDQGLVLLDAEGRIVHANPAARLLLASEAPTGELSEEAGPARPEGEVRGRAHLEGRSLLELADPQAARALSEALTQARAGNWRGELDLRRLDGEPLPVELSLAGGREEGALTVALLRDLRERRLKAFEDRLIAQVDRMLVAAGPPPESAAAASAAVMEALGFSRATLLARVDAGWRRWQLRRGRAPRAAAVDPPPAAWADAGSVEEVDPGAPELRRVSGDLEGCRSALRVVLGAPPRLSGYLILGGPGAGPADASTRALLGQLAPQLALALESGRLRLETEALAAYQALLLDQTSVLIGSIDAAGQVVTWNRAAEQLVGIDAASARGRRFGVEVARLADPVRWDSLWSSLQRSGAIAAEVAVLAEGGQEIPLHLEGRLLRAADGGLTGAVLVGLDLRRRRALEDQVLRAQKLAAVGLLAAGIAHEINNPLSGVVGYSRLLLEKPLDPAVREKVEKIAASGERCRKIVEGVLLFSRQREGGGRERRPVELGALIDRVISIGEYQWRMHNVRILREGASAARAAGDAQQLEQVLLNLLSNAVDAMPRGGRVRIVLGREEGRVRLEISDEGTGIAPEILGRIFDPFFSTKEIGKGTGLGLAISYGIIKDHGGDILVRSQPGQGTTFTILLPEAPEGAR